ncbi:MAG: hypothetical protein KatS3mg062_0201 [Tepidiforma sp.]|nr:MAG: hypothetical protein KatS3mg062_0201 [Tepidiforma sp.]
MVEHCGRLQGPLFTECAEWVWEQLQEEGIQLQGELIELILETERELGIHRGPVEEIAETLAAEFERRGVVARPYPLDARVIRAVLDWEDDFLGFAGIPRAES